MGGSIERELVAPAKFRTQRFWFAECEYLVVSYPVTSLRAPKSLTDAERRVALAFARGEPMRKIAAERATAVRTVANQIRAVYRKLAVRSRLQLASALVDASG